ncbi:MAG: hypothetical protein AAGI46_06415 [Planctomycetota bacterium]
MWVLLAAILVIPPAAQVEPASPAIDVVAEAGEIDVMEPAFWAEKLELLHAASDDAGDHADVAEAWAMAGDMQRSEIASARARAILDDAIADLPALEERWQTLSEDERLGRPMEENPMTFVKWRADHWCKLMMARMVDCDVDGVLAIADARHEWLQQAAERLESVTLNDLYQGGETGDTVEAYWAIKIGLHEVIEPLSGRQRGAFNRISFPERVGEAFAEVGEVEAASEWFTRAFEAALDHYREVLQGLPAEPSPDEQFELENARYYVTAVAGVAARYGHAEHAQRLLADDLNVLEPDDRADLLNALAKGATDAEDWDQAAKWVQATLPLLRNGDEPTMGRWWSMTVAKLRVADNEAEDWRAIWIEFAPFASEDRRLPEGEVRVLLADMQAGFALIELGRFDEAEQLLGKTASRIDQRATKNGTGRRWLQEVENAIAVGGSLYLLRAGEAERARRLPARVLLDDPPELDETTWLEHAYDRRLFASPRPLATLLARNGEAEAALEIAEADFEQDTRLSDIAYFVAEAAVAEDRPELLQRLADEMQLRDESRHARIIRFTLGGLTGTKSFDMRKDG